MPASALALPLLSTVWWTLSPPASSELLLTDLSEVLPTGLSEFLLTGLSEVLPTGLPGLLPTDLSEPTGLSELLPTGLPELLPTGLPELLRPGLTASWLTLLPAPSRASTAWLAAAECSAPPGQASWSLLLP